MQLTRHAQEQMIARHIHPDDLVMAFRYGERFEIRGRCVFALGNGCGAYPEPLPQRLHGLVVIAAEDETVITAYRSHRPNLRARLVRRSTGDPREEARRQQQAHEFQTEHERRNLNETQDITPERTGVSAS